MPAACEVGADGPANSAPKREQAVGFEISSTGPPGWPGDAIRSTRLARSGDWSADRQVRVSVSGLPHNCGGSTE